LLADKSQFEDRERKYHGAPALHAAAVKWSGWKGRTINTIAEAERPETTVGLRESEIRYRRLFEAARDGILILDPRTRKIIDANPFMSELLGYTNDELLGKELWEIGLLRDKEHSRTTFRELKEKRYVRYEDLPLQSKAGLRRAVEFVSNVYNEDGRDVIQCNIRDITARQRAEEALRTSEERFRALFELGPIAVYSIDALGVIREFNARAAELWGRKPALRDTDEKFCGSFKLFRPDGSFMPHEQCPMAEVVSGKVPAVHDGEVHIERPNGSRIVVMVNIRPLKNQRGEITGAINCFYDITERQRIEAELRALRQDLESRVHDRTRQLAEAQKELIADAHERKRLEAEVAKAVEAEQLRLGEELHDGLAQELTGIGMMLELLGETLSKSVPKQAREALRLRGKLAEATEHTRNMAKSFYPVEFEKHGLLVALQELARHTERSFRVPCVVQANRQAAALLKDTRAIQLFRIAQEAVHNATKHAKANKILIGLTVAHDTWALTVKDDGVGLGRDAHQAKGMGVHVMEYRARMIGGTLSLRNGAGGGALVSCVVPAGKTR
jgi:PAS domain S-box-containing protein